MARILFQYGSRGKLNQGRRGSSGLFQTTGKHPCHDTALRMSEEDDSIDIREGRCIIPYRPGIQNHSRDRIRNLRTFTFAIPVKIEPQNGISLFDKHPSQKSEWRRDTCKFPCLI